MGINRKEAKLWDNSVQTNIQIFSLELEYWYLIRGILESWIIRIYLYSVQIFLSYENAGIKEILFLFFTMIISFLSDKH